MSVVERERKEWGEERREERGGGKRKGGRERGKERVQVSVVEREEREREGERGIQGVNDLFVKFFHICVHQHHDRVFTQLATLSESKGLHDLMHYPKQVKTNKQIITTSSTAQQNIQRDYNLLITLLHHAS